MSDSTLLGVYVYMLGGIVASVAHVAFPKLSRVSFFIMVMGLCLFAWSMHM